MDTDSFILEIEAENVYEDIKNHLDRFDTSHFKADNLHRMPINHQSVIGNLRIN